MNVTPGVLVESKTARDESLLEVGSTKEQKALLNKVKGLLFAVLDGKDWMTTDQVAEYYDVSVDVIKKNTQRFKDEFEIDGLRVLRGKALSEARDKMSLASGVAHISVYSPSAVLRMGFILRDSEVAKNVRTVSIRLIQALPDIVEPKVLDAIVTGLPVLSSTVRQGHLEIASPFESFYEEIKRKLKKQFPDGGIPGFSKEDIREKLAALSTYTANLKFDTQKQISFPVGNGERSKYPDLMSSPFEIVVDGQTKRAVFMIQISDLITTYADVESSVCRRYVDRAKEHYQCDYAFLFLVSPFGATPEAKEHLQRTIPDSAKDSIGVMTVQQVAQLLRDQAWRERDLGTLKGKINQEFSDLLEYEIPKDQYFEGDEIQTELFNYLP